MKNIIYQREVNDKRSSFKMRKIDAADTVPDFPVLTEDDMWSIIFGVYQLKHAFSHLLVHANDDKYGIFVRENHPNILQGKTRSRHTSSKSYYLWIQCDVPDTANPIQCWYCQCKSVAQCVGSCSHFVSVLWYSGIKGMVTCTR